MKQRQETAWHTTRLSVSLPHCRIIWPYYGCLFLEGRNHLSYAVLCRKSSRVHFSRTLDHLRSSPRLCHAMAAIHALQPTSAATRRDAPLHSMLAQTTSIVVYVRGPVYSLRCLRLHRVLYVYPFRTRAHTFCRTRNPNYVPS